MARKCEVCGRKEDYEHADHPYDIIDVCDSCTEDALHPHPELKMN